MAVDRILHNAEIATNGVPSFVEAIAIQDDKIVAVGTEDEILRQRGPATTVIDAAGRTVIPGLNDSHLHAIRGGINYKMELRWDGVASLADALRMLKEQADRTPPPQWSGWSAGGGSSSSGSAACRPWTRSTPPRLTPPSSCCTSTIKRL